MTTLHGTWAAIRAHMAASERCCNQCARVLDHEQYGSRSLTARHAERNASFPANTTQCRAETCGGVFSLCRKGSGPRKHRY